MNDGHWVLLAFLAAMVCSGGCRPREAELKNIYPVYRSEKQLEIGSRYEKSRKDDSVSYHRIDIPYENANVANVTDESPVENNSKSIIDYVPVALTVKRPNIKVWPNDQNGIESADDLSLYNTYTNNINPQSSRPPTTHDFHFHRPPHPEPPVLVLEGPAVANPFYDYDKVYTRPIQVLDRPPPRPLQVYPLRPTRLPSTKRPTLPPTQRPTYVSSSVHVQTEGQADTTSEVTVTHPTTTQTPEVSETPESTEPLPETTTKRTEGTKCPSVSITTNTVVNNGVTKEGCQNIDIHINTDVGNVAPVKPNGPSGNSGSTTSAKPGGSGLVAANRPSDSGHGDGNSGQLAPSNSGGGSVAASSGGLFGFFDAVCSPTPTTEEDVRSEAENVGKTGGKVDIESIATVARASNDGSPLPPPTSLGHVLDAVGQLAESDIRTPPKLKEIIKEKANEQRKDVLGENSTPLPYTFVYEDEMVRFEEKHEPTETSLLLDTSEGKASNAKVKISTDDGVKGIAIPVVMDDDYEVTSPGKKLQKIPEVPKPPKEDKKKTGVTKTQSTTTPSSGLSTWILLSDNRDVTTPMPKKNNSNNKKEEEKKKTGVTTTTKKPSKAPSTTPKSTSQNKKVTPKPATKKPDADASGMSALEALVKNQKKGTATTSKPKPTETKKKVTDRLDVAESKDRITIELVEVKPTHALPPALQVQTTDDKSVTTTSTQATTQTTESSVEGTTKKKSSTKKKKKNKNRKKKPAEDTGVEAKIPSQPVGSQIYNFLSREIVPTVGLGLIGVALTAGLASFLGYNPFGSSTIPLRRTYDTHHGYSPNYYNYNGDYGDGGQSEEVLFREVLSGMPEESRYGLTHADASYPDAYNRPDHSYDGVKNYPTGYNSEKDVGSYDAVYPQDYSTGYGTSYDAQDKKYPETKEKYPVYTRETGTSFVYPETTGMTSAEKASRIGDDRATQSSAGDKYGKTNPDKIERQPEALYRVAGESDLQYRNKESTVQGVSGQNNWHRIGSPSEAKKSYPVLEPGPRSLEPGEKPAKKRTKRSAESVIQRISRKRTKKENDVENEVDFEDSYGDVKFSEQNLGDSSTATPTTTDATASPEVSTTTPPPPPPAPSVTEEIRQGSSTEASDAYDADADVTAPPPSGVSVLDVLKRLAQFKLRLGLNFLRSTTDIFSRYLDDIQRRVDESFANATTTTVQYNRRKSPWSRIFFSRLNDDVDSRRRKRSVLEEDRFLGAVLTEDGRFSKSTKKDLRPSNKIFHQKKNAPKKFESKRTN